MSEQPVVGAPLRDLGVSGNPGIVSSSSSASTNASQLGCSGWVFDAGSPGNTSRPHTQSTVYSGGSGAGPQLDLLQSNEVSTPDQEKEDDVDETLILAATAPGLAQASGEQSATHLSPAEFAIVDDSPMASAVLGTATAVEQVAAAAVVVTAEKPASLVCSPPQQVKDVEMTPAVGTRVAAALTSSTREKRCQSGLHPGVISPQPETNSEPQLPTPQRKLAKALTADEARLLRFSPTVEDGSEEKGQDRSSIINVISARLGDTAAEGQGRQPIALDATVKTGPKEEDALHEKRSLSEAPNSSIKNVFLVNTAEEGRGKQPTERKATENAQPNVERVFRKWRFISQATPSRSMKNVVDRMAVTVAEAKKNRRNNRVALDLGNVSASVPMELGSRMPMRRRDAFVSNQHRGAKDVKAETRMDVEAANEVWDRVMKESSEAEFYGKRVASRPTMPAEG